MRGIIILIFRFAACALLALISCVVSLGAGPQPYQLSWQRTGFEDRRDVCSDVVTDAAGNIYVDGQTGEVYGTPPVGDAGALVAKYDPAGNVIWQTLVFSSRGLDHVPGMATDLSGNVFIGGDTYRFPDSPQAFLAKYSPAGKVLWTQVFGTPKNEFGYDLTVDNFGNAYVVGSTTGSFGTPNTSYDAFVAKYSNDGVQQWVKQYSYSSTEVAVAATATAFGNVYIAGSMASETYAYLDKLNSDGTVAWHQLINYSTLSSNRTQFSEITSDQVGNIYLVGFTDGVYSTSLGFVATDAVIAKYEGDGNLLWQRQIEAGTEDVLNAVSVDAAGNVYVGGSTDGAVAAPNAGETDSIWAKYDSAGNLLWIEQYGTPNIDSANGISVDGWGRVYVAGNSMWTVNGNYIGESDVFLQRFDLVPEPATYLLGSVIMVSVLFWRVRPNC